MLYERSATRPSPGPDVLAAVISRWAERCLACCSPLDMARAAGEGGGAHGEKDTAGEHVLGSDRFESAGSLTCGGRCPAAWQN
eukprot:7382870-Prymnesium_polylepis.1